MKLPISFRRVARFEYDEAIDWHKGKRRGLGHAFSAAVDKVLDRIREQPDFYPLALDDIREASVSGFPYCVYFRVIGSQIVVIGVVHGSRDASIWQARQ